MSSKKKKKRWLIVLLLVLNFLCLGRITGLFYIDPYPQGISLRIHHGNLVWMKKPEHRTYLPADFNPRGTLWFQTEQRVLFWRP